jgi:hypothetical protein
LARLEGTLGGAYTGYRNGHNYSTRRLGLPLELAAALKVAPLADARKLERELKRKKNPRLALFLLEQRRQ